MYKNIKFYKQPETRFVYNNCRENHFMTQCSLQEVQYHASNKSIIVTAQITSKMKKQNIFLSLKLEDKMDYDADDTETEFFVRLQS